MKPLIVRIACCFTLLFAFLWLRPAEGQASKFKVGDSVEVLDGGTWTAGVVAKEPQTAPFVGVYIVTAGNHTMMGSDSQNNIRAHANNAQEAAVADVSAKAFASWPAGDGLDAQYGSRLPATCPSRKTAPSSADVAKKYLLCDMEGLDGFANLILLTDATVQVASPRAFIYNQDSGRSQIDVRAPVYDLKGSFKEYQCGKPNKAAGPYPATHDCNMYAQPQAAGSCYKDTFGDWHCLMVGSRLASTNQVQNQMPPR